MAKKADLVCCGSNVDRDIGRYSGRHSVDSRSIVGRHSVETRPIVVPDVSRPI